MIAAPDGIAGRFDGSSTFGVIWLLLAPAD